MERNKGKKQMRIGMLAAALSVGLSGCSVYEPIDVSAATQGSISVTAAEKKGPGVLLSESNAPAETKAMGETQAAAKESAETELAVLEARDERVYIQRDNVNVRTSPEVKDDNLAFVAGRGQDFHRTGYSDGFSRIEIDGKIYYISSEYLSVNPPEPSETKAASKEDGGSAYANGQQIGLDSGWKYADFAAITSGKAVFYQASQNRKGKIIAVNAGHGTEGGTSVKTYCHPDQTPKVTGGTTKAGATKAVAVSSGMTFQDGTPERKVTLRMAQILKEKLLASGYDVLMLRDGADVQLDNVARTVIANNVADCHISLHWDGDGLSTIKGCFYMSVPDGLKSMEPVASHWQEHERLGDALIAGLKAQGLKIWGSNPLDMDLTQTSFSTIPSVDVELGNQCSRHDDAILTQEADGLVAGVNSFFGF